MAAHPTTRRAGGRHARRLTPYLLIAPAIVLELLIHIIPMLVGVWMSFVQLTQYYIANWSSAPWQGLSAYKVALNFSSPVGDSLLHSFKITCLYTVVVVAISWFFGMSAALVLHRKFRGRGLFRTLFLVPYAMPIYAGIMTWNFMLQRDNGLVNHVLKSLGITDGQTFWLIGGNAFWSMVVIAIWRTWPFAFLMLLAGLQNIPEDVYDAAAVDGAGIWRQIRYITLPALRPVNLVLVLMMFLWTFNDFNTPFVLFGAQPPTSADLVSVHIYGASFVNWNFGFGSAMSVLLLLFLLVVTGAYLLIFNRRSRRA
ncbi:carbohydrate ABC transporter permease [Rudaeicoccus suwonensis]|uniref:Carbohydrate ABC transporter membrane protein 1 (CUT1 family) n=1 Tax=Rudaeicoccus suwonensis TaxID=657409 RepID=A0A561DX16_9MICO|nr:sugar ABC transporter permease [Rudaeicoccus suwonensis]TWE07918.1 carbohydrate ABC transporter membrane protein 1 (CUT1 family) [Rudaeicoccus suwonensis]